MPWLGGVGGRRDRGGYVVPRRRALLRGASLGSVVKRTASAFGTLGNRFFLRRGSFADVVHDARRRAPVCASRVNALAPGLGLFAGRVACVVELKERPKHGTDEGQGGCRQCADGATPCAERAEVGGPCGGPLSQSKHCPGAKKSAEECLEPRLHLRAGRPDWLARNEPGQHTSDGSRRISKRNPSRTIEGSHFESRDHTRGQKSPRGQPKRKANEQATQHSLLTAWP